MNPESEDPKQASEAGSSDKNSEVVRKPILPKPSDAPDESDKPRSPGAQERDVTIPTSSPEEDEVEVVRRPIIPIPEEPAEPDDPRSPGVQDRDAIAPPIPSSADTKETEVIRKPVVPNPQVESEDEDTEL